MPDPTLKLEPVTESDGPALGAVFPPEIVPVGDPVGEGEDVWAVGQAIEILLVRWTVRASLALEELDNHWCRQGA